MPNVCRTCPHPQRKEIEAAIITGEPVRRVAKRFGLVDSSVARHMKHHAGQTLAKAREKQELVAAQGVASKVQEYLDRAERLAKHAESAQDVRNAVAALRTAHDILRTQGELTGELGRAGQVNITLGVTMETAKERLALWELASALPASEVVERAVRVIERAGVDSAQAARLRATLERGERVEVIG